MRRVLHEMRNEWTAYLFNAPGLIIFAIFVVYSLYVSFLMSFHEWDLIQDPVYVGLDNYQRVFDDPEFYESPPQQSPSQQRPAERDPAPGQEPRPARQAAGGKWQA